MVVSLLCVEVFGFLAYLVVPCLRATVIDLRLLLIVLFGYYVLVTAV